MAMMMMTGAHIWRLNFYLWDDDSLRPSFWVHSKYFKPEITEWLSSSDYFSAIIVIKIIKCHNNNQYFDDLRSMIELLWRMITINNMIFWNQHKTIKVFKIKTIIVIIINLVLPEKQSWVVMKARKQKPRHRGRTVRHQHTILQVSFGFLIIIFLVLFFFGIKSDYCLALSLCKSVPLLNFSSWICLSCYMDLS